MTTIHDKWRDFEGSVFPCQESDLSVTETKAAFYAGALCSLSVLGELTTLPVDESRAAYEQFVKDVKGGANSIQQTHGGRN